MSDPKHFAMSVFNAVYAIRRYLEMHPGVDAQTAARSIPRIDSDYEGSDFSVGLELHELLPQEIKFTDPAEGFRETILTLVTVHRPLWIRFAPYGRERVRAALSQNELQCLRSADLFEEPPTDSIVAWWDGLAQRARNELNERLLLQGREAERLSLIHERERLAALKIIKEPRWVSIENNAAGYDIQSYSPGVVEPVSRLIEVKSSTYDPPRIFLTRNEWNTASSYGSSFVFHIWELPAKTLIERTVEEIALHIPDDRGNGEWTEIEITIA